MFLSFPSWSRSQRLRPSRLALLGASLGLLTASPVFVNASEDDLGTGASDSPSSKPRLAQPQNFTVFGYLPEWQFPHQNFRSTLEHVSHLVLHSLEIDHEAVDDALDSDKKEERDWDLSPMVGPTDRIDKFREALRHMKEARAGFPPIDPSDNNAGFLPHWGDRIRNTGRNAKFVIGIGGPNNRSKGFRRVVNDKGLRKRFLKEMDYLVFEDPGFDGVDYSWEFPGWESGTGYISPQQVYEDFHGLGLLLKGTRKMFNKRRLNALKEINSAGGEPRRNGMLNAHAIRPKSISIAYYPDGQQEQMLSMNENITRFVDHIHAMAYDARGHTEDSNRNKDDAENEDDDKTESDSDSKGEKTVDKSDKWHHSPLSLAEKVVKNARETFGRSDVNVLHKVSLGVPFYGRGEKSGEILSYDDALMENWNSHVFDKERALIEKDKSLAQGDKARRMISKNDLAKQISKLDHVDVAVPTSKGGGLERVYYNGPATVRRKVKLAAESGLGGVMLWESGQDCRGEGFKRGKSAFESTCDVAYTADEKEEIQEMVKSGEINLDLDANPEAKKGQPPTVHGQPWVNGQRLFSLHSQVSRQLGKMRNTGSGKVEVEKTKSQRERERSRKEDEEL